MTSKPQSTISYNTETFLRNKLELMLQNRYISDYLYIHHKGEDGDKDHYHVRIVPNKRLDMVDVREDFKEVDISSSKPLGCLPWRDSKEEDFILYCLHDPVYLVNHNSQSEDGKIEYQLEDFECPFPEQLERDYKRALRHRKTQAQLVFEMFEQGRRRADILVATGINPLHLRAYEQVWRDDLDAEREVFDHAELVDDDEIDFSKSLAPINYGARDGKDDEK